MTVSRALTLAGGKGEFASNRAYVLRDGQRIRVNLRRIAEGRDSDFALAPDDKLVVRTAVF
jgi:hypothetical protein